MHNEVLPLLHDCCGHARHTQGPCALPTGDLAIDDPLQVGCGKPGLGPDEHLRACRLHNNGLADSPLPLEITDLIYREALLTQVSTETRAVIGLSGAVESFRCGCASEDATKGKKACCDNGAEGSHDFLYLSFSSYGRCKQPRLWAKHPIEHGKMCLSALGTGVEHALRSHS